MLKLIRAHLKINKVYTLRKNILNQPTTSKIDHSILKMNEEVLCFKPPLSAGLWASEHSGLIIFNFFRLKYSNAT